MIKSKRLFTINSRDRQGGTDSDFYMNLDIPPHTKFNRICALLAIVPKSYYLVQAAYNTFSLVENGSTATVTIVPGNYSSTSFVTLIPALLNAASVTLGHTWVYKIPVGRYIIHSLFALHEWP